MIAIIKAARDGLLGRDHIVNNILSGIVVGVVAIPLAMAFAIASGARPEQGLYTAIVSGIVVSLFGGSPLQIAGPTGAFIVILSGITARFGIDGLQVATLMAGVILMLMGLARLGAIIKFIPEPVTVGFTAGIGVIIWVGQWKDFFGLPAAVGKHFHEKLWSLLLSFPHLSMATTCLGLLSLGLMLVGPRLVKRIPAPLLVLVVATVLQSIFQFQDVATIGTAFGGIPRSLPVPSVPDMSFDRILELLGPAFTIALLGAIESLLSAVVADGMAGTRHDPNQELVGQGLANIACPLLGGFAATGAIARTATNIKNGATGPLSGVVHSATVLLTILILAPLASSIPLCALAAILFIVAYNMSEMARFIRLVRTAARNDVMILLVTFLLTVFADLVLAVNLGVALASLLFMARMANTVQIEEDLASEQLLEQRGTNGTEPAPQPPSEELLAQCASPRTLVYTINGPFFFAAAEKIEQLLTSIQAELDTLVLRFGDVPFVDSTGMQTIVRVVDTFQRRKVRVILCKLRPNVRARFEKVGILAKVGADNIITDLGEFCMLKQAQPA